MIPDGYTVIAHLSRTRRLDTYEVWSDERACSCVLKTLRPDRRGDVRARAALRRLAPQLRREPTERRLLAIALALGLW